MGCCNCIIHDETSLTSNLEKIDDNSKLTSISSLQQSTPVNDLSNPPENHEDPDVASEIYVISMKLPDYTSEASVHSWILGATPDIITNID